LGASPQTPWVGFAEFCVEKECFLRSRDARKRALASTQQNNGFLGNENIKRVELSRSGTTLFASFSGKRRIPQNELFDLTKPAKRFQDGLLQKKWMILICVNVEI
jgi:hypothetical protein